MNRKPAETRKEAEVSTLTPRESRPFAELFEWMESPITMFRPLLGQNIRMEDFFRDGHYVVRAELPGLDPQQDLDVTVSEGVLSIKAERREQEVDKSHSEFRYGALSRRVPLPASADQDHVKASYDNGILEVVVDLKQKETTKAEKHIEVKPAKTIKSG
jgi:HSP20 family molecular chaperone IbpA